MPRLEPHDIRFFPAPADVRAWLEANHATASELWMGFRSKASGLRTVSWAEAVDELLCFGWIDGVRMPLGPDSAIRVTPRRPGSNWSSRNVGRVDALRAEGRMRPAGEAAFAGRHEDRTAVYSFEAGLELDAHAQAAMRARPEASTFWDAQPRGYRRSAAHWVMSAKRARDAGSAPGLVDRRVRDRRAAGPADGEGDGHPGRVTGSGDATCPRPKLTP